MSRRRAAEPRKILPDPKYNDFVIAKFINTLMLSGKKSVARRILYNAMDVIAQREDSIPPLEVVKIAVENIRPTVEVKSRRVGGSTYQVPIEVRPERRQSLALRWLIQNAQSRGGKDMENKLAAELLDAYQKRGGAMRKKEDVHRMAEANRAFAHYRW
ncbi:MAG: 30S ribosomal protein S7 [SAR324 cluster bacterium]|nr:30S ribosomal protein S7 [SAR324 cluster bacterium]MCZ6748847.1 30S ribosomal protein S7 [SAR324 cluster bacterium]